MSSSKKKVTQDELRRLMNEQKKKCLNNVKKIESPLARYDKNGVLHCIICETVVRSDAVWGVHLNSKNHKQNIQNKIKKKEEAPKTIPTLNESNLKRQAPAPPPPTVPPPPKKLKGILKNSSTSKVSKKFVDPTSKVQLHYSDEEEEESDDESSKKNSEEEVKNENDPSDPLPEGFFDDPKLDAKVRNVEYKDPIEEEWELFQKEIKEETSKAQQIIAEDQEEATTERQIDEIDEQIRNWSRVLSLEKKKETVSTGTGEQKSGKNEEETSGDEEDFEEFLDWRCKKSFEFKQKKDLAV